VTEDFRKRIVQRITRNFLDILVLRLIQTEPMWGYKIIKKTEKLFGIKPRHGALYPLLNTLEKKGYTKSKKTPKGGRIRKVYTITQKGIKLVDAYQEVLKEQLQKLDLKNTA
jgi:PadR family transcriptional regulator PadR